MKQAVLGALAAIATILGLAAAPTAANAVPYVPGQTVGSEINILSVRSPVAVGVPVKVTVRVNASAGSGTPRGRVRANCRTISRGQLISRVGSWTSYTGGRLTINGPRLSRQGRWNCYVKFVGTGVWGDDADGPATVRAYAVRR